VGSRAARMYRFVTQPHNIQERDRQQEPASPVDSQRVRVPERSGRTMPDWVAGLLGALLGGGFSLAGTWWGIRAERGRQRETRAAQNQQDIYFDYLRWYDEVWGSFLAALSDMANPTIKLEDYRPRQIPEALLARLVVFGTEGPRDIIKKYREVSDWVRLGAIDKFEAGAQLTNVKAALSVVQVLQQVVAYDLGTGDQAQIDEQVKLMNTLVGLWKAVREQNRQFSVTSELLRTRHAAVKEAISKVK
jgi:hypothetical protein